MMNMLRMLAKEILALCCISTFPHFVFSQTLSYQISLSELLTNNPPNQTIGNVNIYVDESSGQSLEIAYFPYLMSFTCGDGLPTNVGEIYDGVASISLAMEHLNTGNGTIIPEVSGLNESCPLRFTTKSFDDECQQLIGVEHVVSLLRRGSGEDQEQLFPSAILGATYSTISMPTALISGIRGVPQISPASTSSALDDKDQFKLFGRTIPNDDGTAIPLIAKLNAWNVNYLAILYIDNSYGSAFVEGIMSTAQKDAPNLTIQSVNIISNPGKARIRMAIEKLAATQYTYFFGILFETSIDEIMTEAYNQGIAGTGRHTWIFSDSLADFLYGRQFETGSKLALAYQGSGVLFATGGISGMLNYDKLSISMQDLRNEADITYLESLFPKDYADGKVVNHSIISRDEAFLTTAMGAPPFLYDAVIALGLASCELRSKGNASFAGEDLFEAFKKTTFEGTSGSVLFDQVTGSRDPNSAIFLLRNYVYDDNVRDGMIQFKSIDTDIFSSGQWESITAYTFNDGTNTTPVDLPPLVTNSNYPSIGVKVVGTIFFVIILVLSVGFGCWTYRYRDKRVLRCSQPLFLYIISAGTLLMGKLFGETEKTCIIKNLMISFDC
jgi:hypothetical protein